MLERLRNPDRTEAPPIPAKLKATLRPYQERGFGWITQMRRLGLGACLADDMGLGKTLQTITYWLYERENGSVKQPALTVRPTSVVGNWYHEISRFAPTLKVYTHQDADRLKGAKFKKAVAKCHVVLTSYALLHRDLETLKQVQWSSVTLDEAQNIKNPATKQTQAARAIEADYRLALTGTPVENRLTELWSIMNFLNPGYLGSRETFRSQFSIPVERYNDQKTASSLRSLTAPFILRRLKTDPKVINDLPEKFENKVYCSLTPEQATLYEALFLYGDTPAQKRQEMIRQFQAPHGPLLFILSLKAGGTGLNLTHASHVFHFDRWYNPAVENQATDRAFRIGQTKNVQVHKFICLGTLEERIDELIEHKKGLAERIIGEGEGWISEMSTDELRDLVSLRREMIEVLE